MLGQDRQLQSRLKPRGPTPMDFSSPHLIFTLHEASGTITVHRGKMNNIESIAQMASLMDDEMPENDFQAQHEEEQRGANGTKRKAEDGGGQPQQRAKRNRYISIACNEVNK